MLYFNWQGHLIFYLPVTQPTPRAEPLMACDTCSVPQKIAEAVEFMVKNHVGRLTVDGQVIERTGEKV